MKFIARGERAQLETASKDPKLLTRTAIDLAAGHLGRAEEFTSQKKYDSASEEFGCYLALIDYTLHFLGKMNSEKGKIRDLYRHVDIALRAHIPRLAVMRRSTPAEYSVNIKAAEEYVRTAREDALQSFYGNTVIPDDPANQTKKPAKDSTSTQDGKHP